MAVHDETQAANTNPQQPQQPAQGVPHVQNQNQFQGQPQPQYVDPNQGQPLYNPQFAQFSAQGSYVNLNPQNGLDRLQGLRSNYGRSIPVNDSATVAYQILELYTDVAQKTNNAELKFTIITPEKHSSPLCALVVHRVITGRGGSRYVAAHSMIVESATPLASRQAQYGNLQLAIPSTAGDTYSNRMWGQIVAELRTHYGEGVVVLDAQASVIYSDLTVEHNTRELGYILSCATEAVNGMLNLVAETPRILTGSALRPDGSLRLVSNTDYNPQPQFTAGGLNVRSDISVTASATANATGFENETSSMPLVTTDLYIDLAYVPQQQVQYGYFGAPVQVAQSTLSYIPRAVITNIENKEMFSSLELSLFGLVSSMAILSNNGWVNAFVPRERKSTIDMRDIGAIGYEIPALAADGKPGHIVLDGDKMKASQLIADTIAVNQIMFSMDIPEVGDNTWILNALIGAANNSPEAIQQIIQACNNLTNGEFAKIYDGSGIVDNDHTRIHLGYYWDNNQKKDIRSVDHLALLNILARSGRQDLVQEYDATFFPDGATTDLRLDNRFKVIQAALGDGAIQLKGYARRVTFRAAFLRTLEAAMAKAGVVVQHSAGNFDNRTARRMTPADYAAYTLGGQSAYQPQMFAWGGQTNYNNVMGARYGNWGV